MPQASGPIRPGAALARPLLAWTRTRIGGRGAPEARVDVHRGLTAEPGDSHTCRPEPTMSDLVTVALICASTVPMPSCSRETALDVIVMPSQSVMECAMGGQARVASLGLASGPDVYVKIRCDRRGVTAVAAKTGF